MKGGTNMYLKDKTEIFQFRCSPETLKELRFLRDFMGGSLSSVLVSIIHMTYLKVIDDVDF